VDPKERAIRDLYHARARRDWNAVSSFFADQIGWHEPGEEDHSGDHLGREAVVALLQRLVAVTGGTFQLKPEAFLNSIDHSAVLVRWSAERDGRRSEGNEIAVYRFENEKIAQVWFYVDGYDPDTFTAVFAFD
jgi:ketosteroid isomerase-like protein